MLIIFKKKVLVHLTVQVNFFYVIFSTNFSTTMSILSSTASNTTYESN